MPAKAGIRKYLKTRDSRLRGNDAKGRFETFYESIKARKSFFDCNFFICAALVTLWFRACLFMLKK